MTASFTDHQLKLILGAFMRPPPPPPPPSGLGCVARRARDQPACCRLGCRSRCQQCSEQPRALLAYPAQQPRTARTRRIRAHDVRPLRVRSHTATLRSTEVRACCAGSRPTESSSFPAGTTRASSWTPGPPPSSCPWHSSMAASPSSRRACGRCASVSGAAVQQRGHRHTRASHPRPPRPLSLRSTVCQPLDLRLRRFCEVGRRRRCRRSLAELAEAPPLFPLLPW